MPDTPACPCCAQIQMLQDRVLACEAEVLMLKIRSAPSIMLAEGLVQTASRLAHRTSGAIMHGAAGLARSLRTLERAGAATVETVQKVVHRPAQRALDWLGTRFSWAPEVLRWAHQGPVCPACERPVPWGARTCPGCGRGVRPR